MEPGSRDRGHPLPARLALRRALLALPLALLLTMAGCGLGGSGGRVVIDWANFVQVGDVTYLAQGDQGRALTADDLGAQLAVVRFKVDGNVSDPGYQSKDGDAAFLAPGAPLYAVRGYAPSFRLAATFAGHLQLYEANRNPRATVGADYLDIGGKVRAIRIENPDVSPTATLARVSDAGQVEGMVAMILAAPVVPETIPAGSAAREFLVFELADGTTVTRTYWPGDNLLQRTIAPPPAFGAAVARALGE